MAALPYDAEVEYLESTAAGREWVDTGFIPSSVTDVLTVDAAYTGTGSAFGCLFGATSRVGGNQRFYQINKTTTSNQFRLITSTGDVFWTKAPEFSGSRHTYVLNKDVLYIDGTQTITGSGTSAESAKLYLFARNNAVTASVDTYQAAWRIYSAKLERNGVVRFDLLPVRVGSVGYFYDKVSGTLLPSGGDPLVVGPDRAKLSAGGAMMIANRESFAVASSRRRLPYDAEVEWVEGSAYALTDYYPSDRTTFVHSCQTGNLSSVPFCGMPWISEAQNFLCHAANNNQRLYLDYGSGFGYNRIVMGPSNTWWQNRRLRLEAGNRYVRDTISGYAKTAASVSFARKTALWRVYIYARFFAHQLYDDGALILDLVPVRKDGVAYLYNKADNRLLPLAGSSVVIGPDVN